MVERVSGESIRIRVYMIANGRAEFCSQPIRRSKTVPKGGVGTHPWYWNIISHAYLPVDDVVWVVLAQ